MDKTQGISMKAAYKYSFVHVVMLNLDQLTHFLNTCSTFFKCHSDPNVVWLYDSVKDLAMQARKKFYET